MDTSSIWPLKRSPKVIELDTGLSECGTFHVVSVCGRLTIDTAPSFLDELRRALRRAKRLKVRLAEVATIDSSGISVLIQGLKMAQEKSVDYVLLDPSPKVRAVIELSQLQDFFRIETSSGEACPGE